MRLACLEEAESKGGGCWSGWGHRAMAALPAAENRSYFQPRVRCEVPAHRSPPASVSTSFSCNALCRLLPRLCSGSPPPGSLPWLPPTPRSRGPSLDGAGHWCFSPWGSGWVVSPLHCKPLAARPQQRGVQSVQKAQVTPAWTERGTWGSSQVPSQGRWFEALAWPQRGPD